MVISDKIMKMRQKKEFICLWTRETRDGSGASGMTGSRDAKTAPLRFWLSSAPPSTQLGDTLLNSFFPSGDWLCHVVGRLEVTTSFLETTPHPSFMGLQDLGWGLGMEPCFWGILPGWCGKHAGVCEWGGVGEGVWKEGTGKNAYWKDKCNTSPLLFPSCFFLIEYSSFSSQPLSSLKFSVLCVLIWLIPAADSSKLAVFPVPVTGTK